MFGWFKRRNLPQEVEQEIGRAVEVLRQRSEVSEVRLFGSANSGRWDRSRSDIDLAVIIDSADPEWSVYTGLTAKILTTANGKRVQCFEGYETRSRQELRQSVIDYRSRLEVHIATIQDIKRMKLEGSVIGVNAVLFGVRPSKSFPRAMEKGRLLFKR